MSIARLILFLWRLFYTTEHPALRTLGRICWVSIAVCVGAQALIMAVMRGFDEATCRALQGARPDVIVQAPQGKELAIPALREHMRACVACRETVAVARAHVLVQHPQRTDDLSHVVELCIVDRPDLFVNHLVHAHQGAALQYRAGTLLLGYEMAQSLGIADGDEVVVRYLIARIGRKPNSGDPEFAEARVPVSVATRTDSAWLDDRGALMDVAAARDAVPELVKMRELFLYFTPGCDVHTQAARLHTETGLSVQAWDDRDIAVQTAFELERWTVRMIIALLVLLTGIVVSALVCMYVMYHEHTYALLLVMGVSRTRVATGVVGTVVMMASAASATGLGLATLLSWAIEYGRLVPLSSAYYVDHVPAVMSLEILCGCSVLSIGVSVGAALIAVRALRRISVYHLLAGSS